MEDLLSLTGDIVAAFVSNNSVPNAELPSLIAAVHGQLNLIVHGAPNMKEDAPPQMMMTIKQSVRPESLGCLICGRRYQTIKRHLSSKHGVTLGEYKAMFALPDKYPTTAPSYSEHRTTLAKTSGLGRKPKTPEPDMEAETVSETVTEPAKKTKAKSERLARPHPKPRTTKKKAKASAEVPEDVPDAA